VVDSTIADSETAVRAATGGRVRLTRTTVFDNTLGLDTSAGGIIDMWADSRVFGNGTDGAPTNTYGQPAAGPPGAQGPQGLQGPQGAQGLQGAQSPPAQVAPKLMVELTAPKLTTQLGKAVSVKYLATAQAAGTLEVRKGRKLVATIKGKAGEGTNTIKWNGKAGKKAAPVGSYALSLTVVTADGQKVTRTAKLTVKKRK
jgi:hypothetical protein